MNKGNLHPLTQFMRLSLQYFNQLGFEIKEGNEVESEWYNFDALNVPANHPVRDVQDTFWLAPTCPENIRGSKIEGLSNKKEVLRTHTTGTEARIIKESKIKPPFRIIVPGRCYRNERTDATHEHTFNQIDGIIVDKNINMAHLIGILEGWIKTVLGPNVVVRTVPSYFPFVEPGMEVHIKFPGPSTGSGQAGKWPAARSSRSEGWLEMLGAGMAHPKVLKNMGIDPTKWQAAMWGPGIDRFAMLKWGINDIRLFNSQDLRFLKQF